MTNGSHGGFFATGTSGASTQWGLGVDVHATLDFYKNEEPLPLEYYAGQGREFCANYGALSVSYAGSIDALGNFCTSKFWTISIGAGMSLGTPMPMFGVNGSKNGMLFNLMY